MSVFSFLDSILENKQRKDLRHFLAVAKTIKNLAPQYANLSDADLSSQTPLLKQRLNNGESLEDILPDAFAVAREATHRILGKSELLFDPFSGNMVPKFSHNEAQLIGGIAIQPGIIAEMKSGEGKTLTALLAAYLNALTGEGVHVVTFSKASAKHDSRMLGPVFTFLGLKVGLLDTAMSGTSERREAYACDITYGSCDEFCYDYLRDNIASSIDQCVQRNFCYAIVDDADGVLIDKARIPISISGPTVRHSRRYEDAAQIIDRLVRIQNEISDRLIEEAKKILQHDPGNYEAGVLICKVRRGDPKNKKLENLNKNIEVQKVINLVETDYRRERKLHELDKSLMYYWHSQLGRFELTTMGQNIVVEMHNHKFSIPDLSEMISEIESDCSLTPAKREMRKNEAYRLSAEREQWVHTLSQSIRAHTQFERDTDYIIQNGEVIIVDENTGELLHGRKYSDGLHSAIEAKEGVRVGGETQALATITAYNYFKMYAGLAGLSGNAEIDKAEYNDFYGLRVIKIPSHRPLSRFDSEDEVYKTLKEKFNAVVQEIASLHKLGCPCLVCTLSEDAGSFLSRLLKYAGIEHEIVNAHQYARKSIVLAKAGRLNAVTVLTSAAFRGTDIIIGGDFEVLANHLLQKEGIFFDELTFDQKRYRFPQLYKTLSREREVVLELGGLHIISTSRHKNRRFDMHMRDCAGQRGEPGSSRFFLSLQDDLMNIFGSQKIAKIMERLGAEEGEVISHPLVSKAIDNAQRRVEQRNYHIRKNLKQYDMLESQRTMVYSFRQKILHGGDSNKELLNLMALWIEFTIQDHCGNSDCCDDWNLSDISAEIKKTGGIAYYIPYSEICKMNREMLFDDIWKIVKSRYLSQLKQFGETKMSSLERSVLLLAIDNLWKDHLYEMDCIKTQTRHLTFGSENSIAQYCRLAADAFAHFQKQLSAEVTAVIFRIQSTQPGDHLDKAKEVYSPHSFSGSPRIVARPKMQNGRYIGRNDLCPCGSGKKYKHCCAEYAPSKNQ
ncbi:MAG: hypothetical protein GF398_13090 [Chitinivibrionales bacterium]|nr:hypothetical protein [Chitinivibrionales bacterium]